MAHGMAWHMAYGTWYMVYACLRDEHELLTLEHLEELYAQRGALLLHHPPRDVVLHRVALVDDLVRDELLDDVLHGDDTHAGRHLVGVAPRLPLVAHEEEVRPRALHLRHDLLEVGVRRHVVQRSAAEGQDRSHRYLVVRVDQHQVLSEDHAHYAVLAVLVDGDARVAALVDGLVRVRARVRVRDGVRVRVVAALVEGLESVEVEDVGDRDGEDVRQWRHDRVHLHRVRGVGGG